jgi:hypothetical protein
MAFHLKIEVRIIHERLSTDHGLSLDLVLKMRWLVPSAEGRWYCLGLFWRGHGAIWVNANSRLDIYVFVPSWTRVLYPELQTIARTVTPRHQRLEATNSQRKEHWAQDAGADGKDPVTSDLPHQHACDVTRNRLQYPQCLAVAVNSAAHCLLWFYNPYIQYLTSHDISNLSDGY